MEREVERSNVNARREQSQWSEAVNLWLRHAALHRMRRMDATQAGVMRQIQNFRLAHTWLTSSRGNEAAMGGALVALFMYRDTSYDGQSFFVRHAYFTGGDEPYERLKRTLRAQIDEAAWSALYSAESIPFDAPATGKIAIKVINHYGDEVLKVYDVSRAGSRA